MGDEWDEPAVDAPYVEVEVDLDRDRPVGVLYRRNGDVLAVVRPQRQPFGFVSRHRNRF